MFCFNLEIFILGMAHSARSFSSPTPNPRSNLPGAFSVLSGHHGNLLMANSVNSSLGISQLK